MTRVLVFLLISILLSRWFWHLIAAFLAGLRGESSRTTPPPSQGVQMVRDPVCGTFVLPERAVTLSVGRERLYFCSTACRDNYRARPSTSSGRPERAHGRTA
jgi:uncharacterized protein